MQLEKNQKVWLYTVCLLAVIAGCWVFTSAELYFLNDDLVHIPLSKQGKLFQRNSFRPISDLSVTLDYQIWSSNAWGYHLTNLLLHFLCTLLLFTFSRSFIKRYRISNRAKLLATMIATLFFVYAFHSETIFWILGRSASLGLLFFLPALIFYLKRSSAIYFVLSIIMFVGGLLAYESNWVFPVVIVCLSTFDAVQAKRKFQKELVYVIPVFIVFALYLFARYTVSGELAGSYEAANFIHLNPIALMVNFASMLLRCFVPSFQTNAYLLLSGFLLLSCFILIAVRYKKITHGAKGFRLIVVILLCSFLPYLSLGINTHSVEGERFLYMPSAFACMFIVVAIYKCFTNYQALFIIFIGLLVYHLAFLYRAQMFYATASKISATTYSQINKLQNKKRLFIDSLPQTHNGALLFRLGFEEGLQWLQNEGTVDTVIVLSTKKDNEHWSRHFNATQHDAAVQQTISTVLIRKPEHLLGYDRKVIAPTSFDPTSDALFTFKNDGLYIVK